MATNVTERFMQTLQEAEQANDPAPLVSLFTDAAELQNMGRHDDRHEAGGADRFWLDYLSVFNRIRSTFTQVTEQDGRAALEWVSEGELNTGQPVRYRGISVIETEGDRIRRFRTYYDSAVFLPQGVKQA